MSVKQFILDYMQGIPGVGVPKAQIERCTATLREFVAGPHYDDAVLLANDSAYTRISIVMPSYNQADFIERSILSVLNQNYPNLQFIIMDGGSTDGTLDVIRKYERYLTWRSEPDRGQTDALNKALMLADGELVGWQNSDDIYFPNAFQRMHEISRKYPHAVLYSGSVAEIDRDDRLFCVPKYIRPTVLRILYEGYILSSQGVFLRREVHSSVGLYNRDLHFAMDLDLWLKVLAQGRAEFFPELVGGFRVWEDTKTSMARGIAGQEAIILRKKFGVDLTTPKHKLISYVLRFVTLLQRTLVTRRHCALISGRR